MNMTIITLGSITYAMKARRLLSRIGIKCEVIKFDKVSGEFDCTYGIKIPTKDFYNAVIILRNNSIKYSVYSK